MIPAPPTLGFLLLFVAGCAAVPEAPIGFRAGAAAVDITPPVGWRKAGGYGEVISTGIHDPLYAKAVVFEQGGERGAIVVCDLCSVGREVSDRARRAVSQRTGIPVSNIVISATHTHGAPEYYGSYEVTTSPYKPGGRGDPGRRRGEAA